MKSVCTRLSHHTGWWCQHLLTFHSPLSLSDKQLTLSSHNLDYHPALTTLTLLTSSAWTLTPTLVEAGLALILSNPAAGPELVMKYNKTWV